MSAKISVKEITNNLNDNIQNSNINDQANNKNMGNILSNMWGPKPNVNQVPQTSNQRMAVQSQTGLWGGDHDEHAKKSMLGPSLNVWNPADQGPQMQTSNSNNPLTNSRNTFNNSAADKMKAELFSSMSGNTTKIMQADPNLSSDTSVFMGGWEKNVKIESMKDDQKRKAKEINEAIKKGDRIVAMDIEKKFKDEVKQISEYQEAKKLYMSKSEFFVEHGGHKEVYFKTKFGIDPEDYDLFLQNIKEFYIEGYEYFYIIIG